MKILTTIFLVFICSTAFAATYYVHPNGTQVTFASATGDCDSLSDCMTPATFESGQSALEGGSHTVIFCDSSDYGSGILTITVNGQDADNRITLQSQTKYGAEMGDKLEIRSSFLIIDGFDFDTVDRNFIIDVDASNQNVQYVTIQNCYITACDGTGVNVQPNHASNTLSYIIIQDNLITYNNNQGINFNASHGQITYIEVRDNTLISNNNDETGGAAQNIHVNSGHTKCKQCGGWTGEGGNTYSRSITTDDADNSNVYHVESYQTCGYLQFAEETVSCPGGLTNGEWCLSGTTLYINWTTDPTNCDIDYNTGIIDEVIIDGNDVSLMKDTAGVDGKGINLNTVSNAQISNNKSYGNDDPGILLRTCTDVDVYNNFVYENDGSGIEIKASSTGINLYSNTIADNLIHGISFLWAQGGTSTLKNNILADNGDGASEYGISMDTAASYTLTVDYNLYNGNYTAATDANVTEGANARTGSPSFINSATDDYKIKTDSDGKDQGETLGSPYNIDYYGEERPFGAAYDIGAHEFAIPPGSTMSGTINLF